MAKRKCYRVLKAIAVRDKRTGELAHLTRQNEGQAAEMLEPKRLAELVKGGILAEDEAEEPAK